MASAEIQPTETPTPPASSIMIFAPRWRRFVAQVIDGLAFTPLNFALMTFLRHDPFIANSILFSCMTVYYIAFLASSWQATLGKRLMKVYVVTKTGEKPSFARIVGRYIAFLIPGMPAFIPSFYITYLTPDELAAKVNAMHFKFIHELAFSFYAVLTTILLTVAVLIVIWYVPIFFTKQRKTIPDMLCGTRVVSGKVVSQPKE